MRGFRGANYWRLKYIMALLAAAFSIVSVIIPAGCGSGEAQRKPAEEPVRIAFALADINRDGNKTIKKVVDRQREQLNAQVTWLDAGNDPALQQKQLDELVGKQIKAVVLQAVDPATAPEMVEKLARAGIKVVALENLPENTPVEGYVASDHAMAGRLQVRFVQEALARAAEAQSGQFTSPRAGTVIRPGDEQSGTSGEELSSSRDESEQASGGQQLVAGQDDAAGAREAGDSEQEQGQVTGVVDYSVVAQLPQQRPLKAVILQGDPDDHLARDITAANRAVLQGRQDISVVKVYEHPGWDSSAVAANLAEVMENEGRIDVILANDSTLAMAAVEFFKMGNLEKSVLTVGAGADENASRGVAGGEHDAEVDLQPEMLGRFALEAAVGLAKNGYWQYEDKVENGDYSVPARIVPVRLVTAQNAYLLQDRWDELKETFEREDGGQQQDTTGQQSAGEEQDNEQSPQGQQNQQDQQGQESQQGGQGKTMLRITTKDGKTMEVQIDGEIMKIESQGQQGGQNDREQSGQDQGSQDQSGS